MKILAAQCPEKRNPTVVHLSKTTALLSPSFFGFRRTPASETLSSRCTSTVLLWFRKSSGFWCRFCTLIFIVPETTLVSSRTLSFFLSIDSILLVLFQHRVDSCDSLPLLPFQFSHFWRQNFAIWVSDLCFSSPSSSIFDIRASISSDVVQFQYGFWVDQTHVLSICTSSPRHHQLGSCSSVDEIRPTS